MSVYDYQDALKLGTKEYRAAISAGEYPFLPVLDEILKHVTIEKEMNMGLVEIPLNRIVGTSTAGRTQAFARNSDFYGRRDAACFFHIQLHAAQEV